MTDLAPLTFTGHSDDVVELDADGRTDEIDAYNGADILITDPDTDEALLIRAAYTEHGTWAIAPTMPSDAHTLPAWDIVIDRGTDSSPSLTVHAPAGAIVTSS